MQGGTQQQQGRTHGGGDGTGGGMSPDQGHDHDHGSVGSHSSGSTRSSRSSFSSHGSSRSGRSHSDRSRSGSDVGNRSGTDDTGADHGTPLLTAKHLRRGSVQQASAAVPGGGVGGSAAGAGASAGAGAGTGSGSSTGGIIVLKGKVGLRFRAHSAYWAHSWSVMLAGGGCGRCISRQNLHCLPVHVEAFQHVGTDQHWGFVGKAALRCAVPCPQS